MSVLINTFIKVVEKGVSRKVTKLASDTNLFCIERMSDSEGLQKDYKILLE